mmetsp:Transcript_24383/g.27039  ORF Transcript_24383/g.27039 Transcript_24383/m.27039 type:complete len:180 (+) Transcript_24383:158-697(+)
MSILKQPIDSLNENPKQTNSFGSWYSYLIDSLTIIILTDSLMNDNSALQMMKSLGGEISTSFPELPFNPNFTIDRTEMERIVKSLSETYGNSNAKIYQAKQSLTGATDVMRNNIGSMIHNSNRLDDIEDTSNNMRSAAHMFSSKGRLLEEKLRRRNRLLMLIIGGIALFFIVIIVMYLS